MENKSDFEYEYIRALCEAIGLFIEGIEKENRSAFVYRGANLKYALERVFYFSFLNNKNLTELFKKWKLGQLPKEITLNNNVEKELAILLFNKELPSNAISVAEKTTIKDIAKSLIRKISKILLLDKIIGFFIEFADYIYFKKAKKARVIITLVHQKFVNYLKPITDSLDSDYQYLSIYERVNDFLSKNKLPFLKIRKFSYKLKNFLNHREYLSESGLILQYDMIYNALKNLRPETAIVIEGNAANNEIVNQACKKIGIKTVCIQQGWSPIIHTGFRNMSYSKMLVWGEGFAKLLAPYNPEQRFISVGSHILNPPIIDKKNDKQITISFFLSAPSGLLTPKIWDEYFNLIMWTAKELNDQKIIISDDPVQPLSEDKIKLLKQFGNLTIVSPIKQKLRDTLNSSDITVLVMSTIILESIAADVLPLVFNITSLPNFFPNVNAYGAGIEVKNIADAQKILNKIAREDNFIDSFKPAMKKFRQEFFSGWGENAVRKIIDEIKK